MCDVTTCTYDLARDDVIVVLLLLLRSRCDVDEEPEDEDALRNRATYEKTGNKIMCVCVGFSLNKKDRFLLKASG